MTGPPASRAPPPPRLPRPVPAPAGEADGRARAGGGRRPPAELALVPLLVGGAAPARGSGAFPRRGQLLQPVSPGGFRRAVPPAARPIPRAGAHLARLHLLSTGGIDRAHVGGGG